MIPLDLVREHCRVDQEEVSDALLTSYLNGAIRLFEKKTGRKLYAEALPTGAPANALQMDEDIKAAILLLVEHRNVHRGAASEGRVAEIPMGASQCMDMHRWFYD